MSQYALERTKKTAQFVEIIYSRYFHKHVDHILRRNSWDIVSVLCYGVHLFKIRLRIFQFLKIDEHSYPYLIFSRQ